MDTINRQDAIKALDDKITITGSVNAVAMKDYVERVRQRLIKLLSAESRWIPVSEELPEEDTNVLVTVHFQGLQVKHKTGWNDHIKPKYYVDIASQIDGEWSSYSDEYKVAKSRHKVIAWMPLPEPYNGGEENGCC